MSDHRRHSPPIDHDGQTFTRDGQPITQAAALAEWMRHPESVTHAARVAIEAALEGER